MNAGHAAGIILAGGASRRFGDDKIVAILDGRPLLHHAIEAIARVAEPVVIVLAPGTPLGPLRLDEAATHVVVARDAVAHLGPLAGVAAGLAILDPSIDRALVVAGDMPSLVPAVLDLLLEALAADPAVGVVSLEASPPSPLPIAVRPAIIGPPAHALLAADRRSLRALIEAVPASVVPATRWRALDPAADTLRDVDTRRDLPG